MHNPGSCLRHEALELLAIGPPALQLHMRLSENEGVPYFGGPYNKDPTI